MIVNTVRVISFLFTWVLVARCFDPQYALKKLHGQKSIEYDDCTISLQIYDNVKDQIFASLEILRVEDIYELGTKIGQTIQIVSYTYDLVDPPKKGTLPCIDKKSNKAYSSIISNDAKKENLPPAREGKTTPEGGAPANTPAKADHGPQDGVNNRISEPLINVVARVSDNKILIKGVVMKYRNGITESDMLSNSFDLEMHIPSPKNEIATPLSHINLKYVGLVVLGGLFCVFLFVTNSDLYKGISAH